MKKILVFAIVVLVLAWMAGAVLANRGGGDIVVNANQAQEVNQQNDQAARQDVQQEANQGNDQAPAVQAPAGETGAGLALDADQAAELRAYAVSMHGVVTALMFDSVLERCTDDVTYCGEAMVLRALVQQASTKDLQTATGDAEYQRKLNDAVEGLGRAYATHDVETVKRALNELIALTNQLVVVVNTLASQ